jgi:hypothetical protein
LDRETSVPLKVAAYETPERIQSDTPNWEWQAKSFDHISGRHYLPLSSEYQIRPRPEPGAPKSEALGRVRQSIRIVHAEFDSPIPSATFWPVVEPGVRVIDSTAPRAKARGAETDAGSKSTTSQEPIRASAPNADMTYWTIGGVALSMVILLVAIVLNRRGR